MKYSERSVTGEAAQFKHQDAMKRFIPVFTSIAAARDKIDRTAKEIRNGADRNESGSPGQDIGIYHLPLDKLETLSAMMSAFIANYKAELSDIAKKQHTDEEMREITSQLLDEEKQIEIEENESRVSRVL